MDHGNSRLHVHDVHVPSVLYQISNVSFSADRMCNPSKPSLPEKMGKKPVDTLLSILFLLNNVIKRHAFASEMSQSDVFL